MNNQFSYSLLQYKHSQALGECVNVGIVFSFPSENRFHFVAGETKRIKCLYGDFDNTLVNQISQKIKSRIDSKKEFDLFTQHGSFKDYLNSVLIEDSSSLQFSEPSFGVNPFEDFNTTIKEYAKLYLPAEEIHIDRIKKDEPYIIKKYTDSLTHKVKKAKLEHRLSHDIFIKSNKVELNFELGWKNETKFHLVKPIGLDLIDGQRIQDKSVRFWGYFSLLHEYAVANDYIFDLLISTPQDKSLFKAYDNAIELLSKVDAPKQVITEDKFEQYSEETIQNIDKEGV